MKKKTIRGDRILDVSTVYFILSSSASLTFIIYHRSHKNHFLICHQQNLISSKMRFSYIPQKYLERENETTRQGINAIKIQALYYSFPLFSNIVHKKTFIINETQGFKIHKDEIHITSFHNFSHPPIVPKLT